MSSQVNNSCVDLRQCRHDCSLLLSRLLRSDRTIVMTVSSGTNSADLSTDIVAVPCGLYPGLESFSSEYGYDDYCNWIDQANGDPMPAPLVLYLQDSAFGRVAEGTVNDSPLSERVDTILQELRLQGQLIDSDRPLQQFICAGAIAVEWADDQLYQLVCYLQEFFFIRRDCLSNWCVCLAQATLSRSRLRLLRVLGFSHLRITIRNRITSPVELEEAAAMICQARQLGMERIGVDLILGGGEKSGLSPELQRFLVASDPHRVQLISGDEGYESALNFLLSRQYENVGFDWFVRPGDPWLQLKQAGRLHWSMLGFTSASAPDVIGVGPGAISSVCEFYGLHEENWDRYQQAIQQGRIPVMRGIELEADDVLRREIMGMILAASRISVGSIEEKWGIKFNDYFAREAGKLREFEKNRLVDWHGKDVVVLVRNRSALVELCRLFYHQQRVQHQHSESMHI